jgi:hypothetical protein
MEWKHVYRRPEMKKLFLLLCLLCLSGCFITVPTRKVYMGMRSGLLRDCGELELVGEAHGENGMIRVYHVTGLTHTYYVTTYQGEVVRYSKSPKVVFRSRRW